MNDFKQTYTSYRCSIRVEESEKSSSSKDRVDYGISILKMLMCFVVICCHFLNGKYLEYNIILFLERCAVPVFMLVAMFYYYNKLEEDFGGLIKRCKKLYFPLFVWAIIYTISYLLINLILKVGNRVTIGDFIWQCVTGHSNAINPAMWFQMVLIIHTILVFLLFRYIENNRCFIVLFVLSVVSYMVQYSQITYAAIFSLRYELRYPLGRMIEMIPIITLGLFVAYFNQKLKLENKNRIKLVLCGILLMICSYGIYSYEVSRNIRDFGYSGISLAVFSVGIFFSFYSLSFTNLSEKMKGNFF